MDPIRSPGLLVLFSNASVAFLLNVAAVFLIGASSGLVLTLAGVFKVCHIIPPNSIKLILLQDILLIFGSVLIFGDQVTFIQVIGYSIALVGLVIFKTTGTK